MAMLRVITGINMFNADIFCNESYAAADHGWAAMMFVPFWQPAIV